MFVNTFACKFLSAKDETVVAFGIYILYTGADHRDAFIVDRGLVLNILDPLAFYKFRHEPEMLIRIVVHEPHVVLCTQLAQTA